MKYDFIIVGSGIIGLTLAYKLKKKFINSKILILEKEKDSTQHGSGRNSGVIHSGIYYEPRSLRATLGVQGGRELAACRMPHAACRMSHVACRMPYAACRE